MILITGKNGQLGWELRRALAPLGPVTAVDAAEMPLEDTGAIRRVIRKLRPTIVVNAAALTDLERAEEQGDLAMAVNGAAPAIIADEVKRLGGGLVHFSTGCVFDGVKKRRLRRRGPAAAGERLRREPAGGGGRRARRRRPAPDPAHELGLRRARRARSCARRSTRRPPASRCARSTTSAAPRRGAAWSPRPRRWSWPRPAPA